MIKLIQGHEAAEYPEIIDQMYQLRARQFNDRLGWSVNVQNGRERDEFDDLNPLYAVYLDDDGSLLGTFRLLQTTGPHMLSEVFTQLLPKGQAIRSPLVWESTRFCVDTEKAKQKSTNGLSTITGLLLSSLLEIGASAGLSHIVTVIDVRMERILLRAKCPVERLADPVKIGKVGSLAILMECNEEHIKRIQDANAISGSCIDREDTMRLGLAA